MTEQECINQIDQMLKQAQEDGLDFELILATVYANHLMSDEQCDNCHMYGISFAKKLNQLMGDVS